MSGRVYINQVSTTVQPNKKCEGCLHYEPQRSKGGLCLVAQQPWNCGEGDHPLQGYAPLVHATPEMIDKICTGVQAGQVVGHMDEYGKAMPVQVMKLVVLGDEHIQLAHHEYGKMTKSWDDINKAVSRQGVQSYHSMAGSPHRISDKPTPNLEDVAKGTHAGLSNRFRAKFTPEAIAHFLIDQDVFEYVDKGNPDYEDYATGNLHVKRKKNPNEREPKLDESGGAHGNVDTSIPNF